MLKACGKCGKIHERGYRCAAGTRLSRTRDSPADRFRNTKKWREKSEEIRTRDFHMCRVCREGLYNTRLLFNAERLSVHHIAPLAEDFGRRLDNGNLITLCAYHHELAESGAIPRRVLLGLAAVRPSLSVGDTAPWPSGTACQSPTSTAHLCK